VTGLAELEFIMQGELDLLQDSSFFYDVWEENYGSYILKLAVSNEISLNLIYRLVIAQFSIETLP